MNGFPPNFPLVTDAEQPEFSPGAPMLHFALDYARRGWPVFPCNPTNKRPLLRGEVDPLTGRTIEGTGGFKKASLDPEQIAAWWKECGPDVSWTTVRFVQFVQKVGGNNYN